MTGTGRGLRLAAMWSILLLGTAIAAEIVAFAALGLASRMGWPSRAEIRADLSNVRTDATSAPRRSASNVLHPYTGFVRNPDAEREVRVNRLLVDDRVNEFGFFGTSPLESGSEDAVRIALTGGSVAEELFLYGRNALADELSRSGVFGDRPIEIVSTAVAGFKQPQQLLAISYLLVLGARFDIVVNVDGFNEVVLPFTDNIPGRLAPSFPFRWNSVAAVGIDPEAATLITAIADAEDELRGWQRAVDRFPLRYSSMALLGWHVARQRTETRLSSLQIELRDELGAAPEAGPQMRGPRPRAVSGEALFLDSVSVWRRASQALHSVCNSLEIAYLHFLQPNQYVTDAKPFSDAERKIALLPERSPTRVGAELGYRLLIAEGRRLTADGVPFFDLTDLFASEREPIYRDACCHYFALGYEMLAKRIATEIAAQTPPSLP